MENKFSIKVTDKNPLWFDSLKKAIDRNAQI